MERNSSTKLAISKSRLSTFTLLTSYFYFVTFFTSKILRRRKLSSNKSKHDRNKSSTCCSVEGTYKIFPVASMRVAKRDTRL